MPRAIGVLSSLIVVVAGCTQPIRIDGGRSDSGAPTTDAPLMDAAMFDGATLDAPLDAGGCGTCDDGVACTDDSCVSGGCVSTPSDARCTAAPGGTCDAILGCQYEGACTAATCIAGECETAVCDGDICRRTPTCAAGVPCCGGTCCGDDDNPCTEDACEGGSCVHRPSPVGTVCGAPAPSSCTEYHCASGGVCNAESTCAFLETCCGDFTCAPSGGGCP